MATATAARSDPRFSGGQTIKQWADALIAKLSSIEGWSLTPTQKAADETGFITWANTESSGYNPNKLGGLNNPLNTTEGALGFVSQGGAQGDIKDYGTFGQGVDAQAYNLVHTQRAGYGAILDALRSGNTEGLYSAVDASSFGTHGLGKGGTPSGPTGTASTGTGTQLTGIDLNPANWWGDIVGGAQGGIAKVVVTGVILAGGATLIVLGAWRSVSPNVRQSVGGAAKLAAIA